MMLIGDALVIFCIAWYFYVLWLEAKHVEVTAAYSLGFFESCFGERREDPTQGLVPSQANHAATNYISAVYADTCSVPPWLRRTEASFTALLVFLLYAALIELLVTHPGTPHPVLIGLYIGCATSFLIAGGGMWLVNVTINQNQGIPLRRRERAVVALQALKWSPIWETLQQQIEHLPPKVPVWWPYTNSADSILHRFWAVLLLAVPIAIGVVAFLHGEAAWALEQHQTIWVTKILVVFALAIEWFPLPGCLVHWGDWKGAGMSTHRTFPLEILLNDIIDLRV
jgi:hypothetical protein